MDTVLDILAIMQRLPHRYPFLLIDRIVRFVPGEEIVALKNVTMNEPFFQGHFPAKPVMPGVLIIEALAQAGGILAAEIRGAEKQGEIIYFMGMDAVRFRKPVVPGDQLRLELEVIGCRRGIYTFSGKAYVEGKLVTESELRATFADKQS